jgi:cyclic beta-1,2-glucan synthetase
MDGTTGTGFTPCTAATHPVQGKLVIVSGCADLNVLKPLADPAIAEATFNKTTAHWLTITSRFAVKTPSEDLNRYLNGWAVYQTYACRVLGRSSLYQSGGAYGFRDQLQDVCALTAIAPEETFAQIVRAAEHQFEEGDVQHWWHPGTARESLGNKGVRTKCSDDLLWLPYALCEYIDVTGDESICDYLARYLTSPVLTEDEIERYEQPHKSAKIEPVFMHALRAIDLVFARGSGEHGLALIGSGDWNDGMNLVGAEGRGESVWLTWFLIHTAERFAGLCEKRGNPGTAARFRESAAIYRRAAEEAWDGSWYLRGYFDDGTPLGSAGNDECRIDSIAQSFSTLAGADPAKIKTALLSTVDVLFNRNDRVIQLFDPPFSTGKTSPGYIKGYSPGFRENGGQYTHGAIWLSMALFKSGMTELGWETLAAILPQGRPLDVYRTEPYVLAADVYSNALHLGRGGWTWYTGASGWYYRVAMEQLLGITIRNGILHVEPNLPDEWEGFELVWKNAGAEYLITIDGCGHAKIMRDGTEVKNDPFIRLAGETADLTEI